VGEDSNVERSEKSSWITHAAPGVSLRNQFLRELVLHDLSCHGLDRAVITSPSPSSHHSWPVGASYTVRQALPLNPELK
jgi:hypothetical protein